MPQQTFSIKFNVNEGLILSPRDLMSYYLYGINVKAKDGLDLSENVYRQKILAAQAWVERWLSLKMFFQVFEERLDFERNDYYNWGFFKVSFPIRAPLALLGFIGTVRQIEYPLEWTSQMRISDEALLGRTLHIVPAGSTTSNQGSSVVFSGITPHLGFLGVSSIPNYWFIKYTTGFKVIPPEIIDVIGKLAAIQILGVLGDLVVGMGISSMSLSIDGLSQSMSKSSGNAFNERITRYQTELVGTDGNSGQMKLLQDYYRGINFMAL